MPHAYILECADGSLYVGSTWDLGRRLWEHTEGLGSTYTRLRRRRPVTIVWSAYFDRIEDAYLFEKRVQGWSRRKRLALIDGRYDDLPKLASRARPPSPRESLPTVPGFRDARSARSSTTEHEHPGTGG